LFRAEDYRNALFEYERLIYRATENALKTDYLLKKSICYKVLLEHENAVSELERIDLNGLVVERLFEIKFQAALNCYLNEDFSNASSYLVQLSFFVKDESLSSKALWLYALVLNEQSNWEEAKKKVIEYIQFFPDSERNKDSLIIRIEELYRFSNYPVLYSISRAQKMSSILPGLGQIFTGHFKEGLISFSFNVIALGFMGYDIFSTNYISAFTLGSGIFQKFYFGGIERTRFLVTSKNNKGIRDYNDVLKMEIVKMVKTY
jgi:tetratricopeptide (TPR) repeat protein